MRSTWRVPQATEGKSGQAAESVLALDALGSLWSNMKLSAEKWQVTHFFCADEQEKWIEDHEDK